MIDKEQILANLGFDTLTSMQQRMECAGKGQGVSCCFRQLVRVKPWLTYCPWLRK